MNILILSGGPRKTGRSALAANYLASLNDGMELIDLSDLVLPVYSGEEEQNHLPEVKKLKEAARKADGFVMISPEYHGGISGALKNALDYLGSDYFAHKAVALTAVAGGGKGGINTLNQMRTIMRALYANAIPKQLVLDPHCFNREEKTLLEEPARLINELLDELQLYTKAGIQIRKEGLR
ncbi:NAD(P)H-dependent oxidoreductase [Bacillus mangrovi]|uniref:NAD(P)H-dependent oxidoreductase n=1 Tax=Metabacillus mangrovi TaxID=1491830 RepID=A0A7X2V4W0_9BACI|nr:NADPH-dependent FMN reductase [Metabacillus mangrovi]MTH53428.1 NAD(P)H-dependent oxidoreductase [Metabacillus mangrovi]